MNFKKIIALILVCASLLALSACGKKNKDVTYREEGLTFTLPSSMRRAYSSECEFHFSTPDSAFLAKKLTAEFMESQELSKDTTAKQYAAAYIENQMLDSTRIDYKEDPERTAYSFKYNASDTGEDYFHYITILGEVGNIWFVDIVCENDKADIYTDTFEIWQASIRTYKE